MANEEKIEIRDFLDEKIEDLDKKHRGLRTFLITIIVMLFCGGAILLFTSISTIASNKTRLDNLQELKMDKADGNTWYNDLRILQAEQSAKWDEYKTANEKDKERILSEITILQADIKQLISNQKQVMRNTN